MARPKKKYKGTMVHVRLDETCQDIEQWLRKQSNMSESIRFAIREIMARYGDDQDVITSVLNIYRGQIPTPTPQQEANVPVTEQTASAPIPAAPQPVISQAAPIENLVKEVPQPATPSSGITDFGDDPLAAL